MSRNPLTLWLVLSLFAAACSAGTPATPFVSPSLATPSSLPTAATRVEVKLTDALRIEPAEIKAPVGEVVTFVVTNAGANDHEFFLGDEAAQASHETEMASGGMAMDEADGIALKPGETKELTMTFDKTGSIVAGCHRPGHYAAGMKATLTIGE